MRRKDACKRDMTEVRLKEDMVANMVAWRKNLKQILATRDDGTGQAYRRC